jgi:hypothetical protein
MLRQPCEAQSYVANTCGPCLHGPVTAVGTTPICPPPPPPPPPPPSPSPPPQRPPGALNSADGDAISFLVIIGVVSAVVGLLCCLAMVCWWTRRRQVELRRKDVNNWLSNMSVRRVSVNPLHRHQAHVCSRVRVIDSPPPPLGGGGGGGRGIEMSGRFVHQSSETKRSSRPDGTIVHEQPWRCSSASSAPNLSVAADFHDHHLDAGKHQLNGYKLRKEGDDGGGDGVGHGPTAAQSELARVLELGDELRKLLLELLTSEDLARASTAAGRVSDSCSGAWRRPTWRPRATIPTRRARPCPACCASERFTCWARGPHSS